VRIGVLALQGDVAEHLWLLADAGVEAVPVKRADELDGLDGIVLPGGESTTVGKLLDRYGLLEPLRERLRGGLPAFGTCAGAIVLGREALLADGRPSDQPLLGVLDTVARRNAFGRQVASFEGQVDITGLDGGPMEAVFIRAPWFEDTGPDVEVLAKVETALGDKVVVVRQGRILASAFHPELTGDSRLHRLFVELVER
jgi:pyridoxal 5'-phosphate synthase pdxT subunit